MHLSLTNVVIIIACVILIILVLLVYARSRQGDQRIIQATNQMFLPLLSAIVITLGIIYYNAANEICTQGVPNILRYVAAIGAVLIVLMGVIRYAFSQDRDRRFITHPVLIAIDFVVAIFISEILLGCM
jgi:cytochrome bd-type quinol oxidase subunit 2